MNPARRGRRRGQARRSVTSMKPSAGGFASCGNVAHRSGPDLAGADTSRRGRSAFTRKPALLGEKSCRLNDLITPSPRRRAQAEQPPKSGAPAPARTRSPRIAGGCSAGMGFERTDLGQAAGRGRRLLIDVERRDIAPAFRRRHRGGVAREPEILRGLVGRRERRRAAPASASRRRCRRRRTAAACASFGSWLPFGHEAAIDHHDAAAGEARRREHPVARAGRRPGRSERAAGIDQRLLDRGTRRGNVTRRNSSVAALSCCQRSRGGRSVGGAPKLAFELGDEPSFQPGVRAARCRAPPERRARQAEKCERGRPRRRGPLGRRPHRFGPRSSRPSAAA